MAIFNTKLIIALASFILIFKSAFSEEKKYTQAEFDKAVTEAVLKKIDDVKKQSISELTKELLVKESKLKSREADLERKEEILSNTRADLERRIIAFEDSKKQILGCIEKNENDSRKRISQLVEVISNMKPAKASQLLTVQDEDISVRILSLIDPKKASKIFNLMDKEVSARLQKQYINMKK